MMRIHGLHFSLLTLLVILNLRVENQPTPTYIPVEPIPVIPFPSLDCNDIEAPYQGSTWNGNTIGVTTIDEFTASIYELSQSYRNRFVPSLLSVLFTMPTISTAEKEGVPSLIQVCVEPNTAVITAIYIVMYQWEYPLNIRDLVAEYGRPDVVVWGSGLDNRMLIWLTQGVAASVSVDETEQFEVYGYVELMLYFPYQSIEDYETRWPYTHRMIDLAEHVTMTPSVPHTVNPFDFDSMLATITLEPTRTPTPAFTPRPISTSTP